MANIGAVNVTVTISPEGARRREFGRTLYVDRVDAAVTEKQHAELIRGVHTYTSSDAVSKAGWPSATRKAADVYFQQVPFPRNLLIGTRTSVAQPSLIFGTALATAVAIEALGDIDVTLNGQAVRFAFDSVSTANYDAILAAITSAINGLDGFSNVTVSVENGALVIQDPDGGSFGTGFVKDANTDALGLSGATVLEKMDQETLQVALDRIESIDPSAYWIGLDPVSTLVEDDAIAFANWVAARELRDDPRRGERRRRPDHRRERFHWGEDLRARAGERVAVLQRRRHRLQGPVLHGPASRRSTSPAATR